MPTEEPAKAAANVRSMANALVVGSREGLVRAGILIQNEVKRLLSEPHSGPSYWHPPGKPGGNPSSLPGEPPALQTGWLRSSYQTWAEGPNVVAIGSRGTPPGGQGYASFLEFGTSKMEPRPHLGPAVEHVREQVGATIATAAATKQLEARKGMGP